MRIPTVLNYCALILIFSCQEPVQLETPSVNEKILTVDGFITTEPKQHIVSLRSSAAFNNNDISVFDPVTNAEVFVVDDSGREIPLENLFNGDYRTNGDFVAVEGTGYALRIELGVNTYISDFEIVPVATEIANLYAKRETSQSLVDGQVFDRPVVGYYIDYKTPSENSFTILDWIATWEYYAQLRGPNTPEVCYPVDATRGFNSITNNAGLSTLELSDILVQKLDLNFKYDHRHSMEVIMYSISKQAHSFHSKVLAQRDLTGSVFDASPTQIAGNIHALNNTGALVFGFFGAFNVSRKRLFTRGSDFSFPAVYPCFDIACRDCRRIKPKTTGIKPDFWL